MAFQNSSVFNGQWEEKMCEQWDEKFPGARLQSGTIDFSPHLLSQNSLTQPHPVAGKADDVDVPGLAEGANRPMTSVPSDPLGTQATPNLVDRRESSYLEDIALLTSALFTHWHSCLDPSLVLWDMGSLLYMDFHYNTSISLNASLSLK